MNAKQQRFIDEYLIDFNATRAALVAGYSNKTARAQGARLLTNANVKAEIDKRKAETVEALQITREQVVQELASLGFANLTDFIELNESREIQLKSLEDIPTDKLKALSSLEVSKNGLKVKLYDKIRALETLGRYTGLLDTKPELSVHVNNIFEALNAMPDEDFTDIPEVQALWPKDE